LCRENFEIDHRSRDTCAKPYIRHPFFSSYENFPFTNFLIFYRGLYALLNSITSDRLWNFCNAKNVQTHLLSKRLEPPSIKFSTMTQNFLQALHRPYRAIQKCEDSISKFHTIVEIFNVNVNVNWGWFSFKSQ